jgi:flagellar operon protein
MIRLQNGARKAEEKGIKESLVIMDSLSFIVNTKNNTVITAMEQSGDTDNVYTNIDGAVII